MLEILIMLGLVAVLGFCAALWALPWPTVFVIGVVMIGVGLVVGLPGGVGYHLLLHRALAPRKQLTPRWWWNPVRLHDRLEEKERPSVMGWFYVGAAGFALAMLGCGVVLVSAIRWE